MGIGGPAGLRHRSARGLPGATGQTAGAASIRRSASVDRRWTGRDVRGWPLSIVSPDHDRVSAPSVDAHYSEHLLGSHCPWVCGFDIVLPREHRNPLPAKRERPVRSFPRWTVGCSAALWADIRHRSDSISLPCWGRSSARVVVSTCATTTPQVGVLGKPRPTVRASETRLTAPPRTSVFDHPSLSFRVRNFASLAPLGLIRALVSLVNRQTMT